MLSVIMDPKGSITAVNSNFEQEMIYSGSQLMGRSWLELVPPYAQKTDHFRRMKEALQQGKHWAGAAQVYRGNGEEAWLRVILQPVQDTKGKVLHVSIYASDLTRTIEASKEHENLIRTANTGHATKQHSLVRSFLD
ncbi:PAS domain-containing protein [Vibrio cholerae]